MRIPVALLVLVSFGCATVRLPAGTVEGAPPEVGAVADPKVELWLEGGSEPSPSETLEAQKAARDALAIALARRHPDPAALGAEDPVIVVRERAVTRTDGRRHEQAAAKVGLAFGFVAVAAAAVVLAVTSKHGGSGRSAGSAAKSTPSKAAVAAAPAAAAAQSATKAAPVATAAAKPVARPVARPRPLPGPRATPRGTPVPAAPHFAPGPPPGPVYVGYPGGSFYWSVNVGFHVHVPFDSDIADDAEMVPIAPAPGPDEGGDDEPEPPPPPVLLALPEMEKLPLSQRGFFDGDQTILEVDVVDRATGTLLYTRRVKSGADPRNRGDVARLLDEALADLPR
jgi:hypothetical protein